MANEYRFNQLNVEVWRASEGDARINSLSVEVWRASEGDARINGLCVEVWRSIEDAPAGTRRRQAMLGSL
jgi:hypothetical protein